MKDIRHLVIIGDTHIGSSVGLMTDEHVTADDNNIQPNPLQQWIGERWQHFWDECVPSCTGNDDFAVVHIGDIIDGDHHGTFQLVTRNLTEQRTIAENILRPIRKRARRMYCVKGTESHVGNVACDEEAIARSVGFDDIDDTGNKTAWELRLQWGPHHVCFRHHIGGGRSLAGQLTQLSNEMAIELHDAQKWNVERADLMFFGHIHTAKWGGFPTERGPMECYVSPSWQGVTAFGRRIGHTLGTVGGYVASYDDHGFYVRKFVWHAPRNAPLPLRFKPLTCSKSSSNSKPKRKTRRPTTGRGRPKNSRKR